MLFRSVAFKENLTRHVFPVCDDVIIGAEVELLGVVDYSRDISIIEGVVDSVEGDKIYIVGKSKKFFSGGPVVDVDRNCVIGVTNGNHVEKQQILAWRL